MHKRSWWRRIFLSLFLGVFLGAFIPQGVIFWEARQLILSKNDLPSAPVALVLGASVLQNSQPSDILAHRIQSAVELYNVGKVTKLLMSGDNSEPHYNEVEVMKQSALKLGIPEADILTDPAGVRTYDSCARAHTIFHFSQAIIVTQSFHLPRALYLCNHLGLESYGYASDKAVYAKETQNQFREFFARIQAFFEVNLLFKDKEMGDS